ncbi:MAG TPA: ribosome biogenesis GTP-binding protein YihA/YsxC [Blastocatellia bacterium]|nr:ribosome biogenesis GTP-binding protein YihA/YsxC [Blastocatellia bacterium]
MKITNARFIRSAATPSDFPADELPEVAFLGRSNVGKSSLINSLLGTKGLARTSSTPGRTQAINFFLINERFYFVDLPGYGYARVPEAIRKEWAPLVENYLAQRRSLMLCISIVDSRHKPTAQDKQLVTWLNQKKLAYAVVATKTDKLSNNQLKTTLSKTRLELGVDEIIPYSSLTRAGVERVWREIDAGLNKKKQA